MPSTFTADPDSDGLQARNNARVAISGSIDLFSNRFSQATVPVPGKSG